MTHSHNKRSTLKRHRQNIGLSAGAFGAIIAVIAVGLGAAPALAKSGGITGFSGKQGVNCGQCHTGGSYMPTIAIEGLASVATNSVNTYTVRITAANAVVGGFNAAGSAGTLATTDNNVKIVAMEATHKAGVNFANNEVTFTFDWTAPAAAGTYTLFAAGIAADNSGTKGGDNSAKTTLSVTVTGACVDTDTDGICDDVDNCPNDANADQADADSDGVGDVCDACPNDASGSVDTDGDGVCDSTDNCPGDANADQADTDSDGVGDVCDICPNEANGVDSDGDGVCDGADNCPNDANADQADSDSDGIGDVCDTDTIVDSAGDEGCGCRSANSGGTGAGIVLCLVGFALVGRRRRRVA